MLGVGAKKKTYMDDVFSTYLYKGNATSSGSQSINNGIDLAGEGGLTWIKRRSGAWQNYLMDTVRGASKAINSDDNDLETTMATGITSFNNNGFSLGAETQTNYLGEDFASWSFRKAPGFFDVKTFSGHSSNFITVNHDLGSEPGLVIFKKTNSTGDWFVWHRDMHENSHLLLNTSAAIANNQGYISTQNATSCRFYVTTNTSDTYVAYFFAGGESTAATARSVEFDGSGDYLKIDSHADLAPGTGAFTVEMWIKPNSWGTNDSLWYTGISTGLHIKKFASNNQLFVGLANGTGQVYADWTPPLGQWSHIAVTRDGSNNLRVFINGNLMKTAVATTDYGQHDVYLGWANGDYDGEMSNVRFIKGTALYTSSFKPTYEPLTNITNTKLLCCNNTSITGSTVTPSTISSNGTVTASTDSPFDDPAGFVFGDSGTENLIKCGSYKTDSNEDATVNLGWEPQWVLTKRTDSSAGGDWLIYDSMRGLLGTVGESGGGSVSLSSNTTSGDNDNNRIKINSTGFYQDDYGANRSYLFVAIRRSDGYVGKPVELGSGCFQMDTGSGSSSIPTYDSGFPVDFAVARTYASSNNWNAVTRLRPKYFLRLNTTNAGPLDHSDYRMDSNVGWARSDNSTFQSWMWKRHAGFDVVYYKPSGNNGYQVRHNLSKTPEMIWIKNRNSTTNWIVGHKDANGGTNPWDYYLNLDGSGQNVNWSWTYSTPPTATAVTLASSTSTNNASYNYIMMLFASVSGISAVGSYTGNGSTSERSFDLGFEPRFFMVKNTTTGSTDWLVIDSLRGFNTNSTDGELLSINNTSAQTGSNEIRKHSNGFKIVSYSSGTLVNANSSNYIYYAHA